MPLYHVSCMSNPIWGQLNTSIAPPSRFVCAYFASIKQQGTYNFQTDWQRWPSCFWYDQELTTTWKQPQIDRVSSARPHYTWLDKEIPTSWSCLSDLLVLLYNAEIEGNLDPEYFWLGKGDQR